LVITGTLWQVPDADADLYQLLSEVIDSERSSTHITVCDSKSLYKSTGTIEALERSVLSLIDSEATDWRTLVKSLGCGRGKTESEPWLIGAENRVPMLADKNSISQLRHRFVSECKAVGVKLLGVKTATIFPKAFNEAIEVQGNKATVLSSTTLNIVSELLSQAIEANNPPRPKTERENIRIVCDKHGGRSKYAGMIQHCLTEQPIRVHLESRDTSRYSWTTDESNVKIEFNARGEAALPVALASMVSKYVREIYMKLWNQFWLTHLPNIKPTKGYPQDAKRFLSEIQSYCNKLKINKEAIWRTR